MAVATVQAGPGPIHAFRFNPYQARNIPWTIIAHQTLEQGDALRSSLTQSTIRFCSLSVVQRARKVFDQWKRVLKLCRKTCKLALASSPALETARGGCSLKLKIGYHVKGCPCH